MSLYKVVRLIGSSSTSWEDAAKSALEEAAKHLEAPAMAFAAEPEKRRSGDAADRTDANLPADATASDDSDAGSGTASEAKPSKKTKSARASKHGKRSAANDRAKRSKHLIGRPPRSRRLRDMRPRHRRGQSTSSKGCREAISTCMPFRCARI